MKKLIIWILVALVLVVGLLFLLAEKPMPKKGSIISEQIKIEHGGIELDALIEGPRDSGIDLLLVYHGSIEKEENMLPAAQTTLKAISNAIDKEILIVSVAYPSYPQQDSLFGDNIMYAEAALLWAKNSAEKDLELDIGNIYLFGHSQGGYMVTRLNALHETSGVIANAPGPIDLAYRCALEEGTPVNGAFCGMLVNEYGLASENPGPFIDRSLISFTSGYKAKTLFIQGLDDGETQLTLWPEFREKVESCSNCAPTEFLELPGEPHGAAFSSSIAAREMTEFLRN